MLAKILCCRGAFCIGNDMWDSFFSFLLSIILFTGCYREQKTCEGYLKELRDGNVAKASEVVGGVCEKIFRDGDYRKSGESTWLLLDRGTINFLEGNFGDAVRWYDKSIEAMDFFRNSVGDNLRAFLVDDRARPYVGEVFEQLLARIYLSLVLMHDGDFANAKAVLRQCEEMSQKIVEINRDNSEEKKLLLMNNPIGKYLFGMLLESCGDVSNAKILYKQAGDILKKLGVSRGVVAMIEDSVAKAGTKNDMGSILIVFHNGLAPWKASKFSPVSIASMQAVEVMLEGLDWRNSLSTIPGIKVPYFKEDVFLSTCEVVVDGNNYKIYPWYNVGNVAKKQLEDNLPTIAARAVARILFRRLALHCMEKNFCEDNIYRYLDGAFFVGNLLTSPDERSWRVLPKNIGILHLRVRGGVHDVVVNVDGRCCKKLSFSVDGGKIRVIDIFSMIDGLQPVVLL